MTQLDRSGESGQLTQALVPRLSFNHYKLNRNLYDRCFDYVSFWGWDPLTPLIECVELRKLVFRSCHGLTTELLEPFNNN